MSQSDSLINHPRLTEVFSHPEHNINIIRWKDIRSLSPPQELRFWSCLAFLFIMPPKYLNHKNEPLWVYQTHARDTRGRNKVYTPKCRYDQFVASHATCCEHHTNYFVHYHRNLMSQYVLALNEADMALREDESDLAKEMMKKMTDLGLQEQYSAAVQFYNEKVMMDIKKQLLQDGYALQQLPWVTPAYWNIFDYESNIELPVFLTTSRKEGENPILDLLKRYRNFQFGQFNYREGWNNGSEDLTYFWRARYTRFESWQKNIIEGKSSRKDYMTFRNRLRSKIIESGYGKLIRNLYEKDNEGRRKCVSELITLTNQEINFQYGGGQNLRYFTEEESQNMATIQSANFSIPYYQYARALLTPFKDFCIPSDSNSSMNRDGFLAGTNSISLPHDLMHDNLGYPSSDASFSIMSPMFMLYHGFVQYMNEQYIRLVEKYDKEKEAYKSLKIFLDTPIAIENYRYTEEQRGQLQKIRWRLQQAQMNEQIAEQRRLIEQFKNLKRRIRGRAPQKKYLQPGFGGFLAEFQEQNEASFQTNGDYPIFQWTLTGPDVDEFSLDETPLIEGIHYSALGTYRELMLNQSQNNIRYSSDLYSFYKKHSDELRVPQQLIDQGYPFSYTFDLLQENSLKDPPIPDYLQRIQNDIEEGNIEAEITSALRRKSETDLQPEKVQAVKSGMKFIFRDSIQKKVGPSKVKADVEELNFEQLQNLQEMKIIRKNFMSKLEDFTSLYCRIQHKANLQNVTVMLSLKIKDLESFKFNNSGAKLLGNGLKQKIINSKGLVGSYPFTVFGKGSLARACPRCKPLKSEKFNLFKYMTGQLSPILLDLHINANIGVLYDSRQIQAEYEDLRSLQRNFKQIVEVSHDYKHSGFEIQIISGAIQANFKVIFCENLADPKSQINEFPEIKHEIKIFAESFDLREKKMFASLQARRKSLNTEVVFEEMSAPIEKNQLAKQLVYKKFKVMLIIDYLKKEEEQAKEKKGKKGRKEEKQSSTTDIKILNFEFQIPNFAIQAFYDIRINRKYEVLVIDSKFDEKMDIFF